MLELNIQIHSLRFAKISNSILCDLEKFITHVINHSSKNSPFARVSYPALATARQNYVIGIYQNLAATINPQPSTSNPHHLVNYRLQNLKHCTADSTLFIDSKSHQKWQQHSSPSCTHCSPHSAHTPSTSPQSPSATSKNTNRHPRPPRNTRILPSINYTRRVLRKQAVLYPYLPLLLPLPPIF
jgi:hypothetical protein